MKKILTLLSLITLQNQIFCGDPIPDTAIEKAAQANLEALAEYVKAKSAYDQYIEQSNEKIVNIKRDISLTKGDIELAKQPGSNKNLPDLQNQLQELETNLELASQSNSNTKENLDAAAAKLDLAQEHYNELRAKRDEAEAERLKELPEKQQAAAQAAADAKQAAQEAVKAKEAAKAAAEKAVLEEYEAKFEELKQQINKFQINIEEAAKPGYLPEGHRYPGWENEDLNALDQMQKTINELRRINGQRYMPGSQTNKNLDTLEALSKKISGLNTYYTINSTKFNTVLKELSDFINPSKPLTARELKTGLDAVKQAIELKQKAGLITPEDNALLDNLNALPKDLPALQEEYKSALKAASLGERIKSCIQEFLDNFPKIKVKLFEIVGQEQLDAIKNLVEPVQKKLGITVKQPVAETKNPISIEPRVINPEEGDGGRIDPINRPVIDLPETQELPDFPIDVKL
ncbi:hypothetical protein A3F66_02645 [candidate division TM6 bacterium RIFCSPHIGHO2_12_FULL_32_22]|nr:MAG: hypothetical protein A3F66_02645 [candidate division TM6 bacterium RIFCSPHIGHO2_12_FULL_32_22]